MVARSALLALGALSLAACSAAPPPVADSAPVPAPVKTAAPLPADPARRSDALTLVLLEALGPFDPEVMGQIGVEGLDEQITDAKPDRNARFLAAMKQAVATLESRAQAERDPGVLQDVAIAIGQANLQEKSVLLSERMELPFTDGLKKVFVGLHALLDDQVPAERRAHALTRLRKYTGLEPGFTPFFELLRKRTEAKLATPGLLPPTKAEVEDALGNAPTYLKGIHELFARFKVEGATEGLARLEEQAKAYEVFVKGQVLPRARTDFRQPAELYALLLEHHGVDMSPAELATRAHQAFNETRAEAQKLAIEVAREKKLASPDLIKVLAALKKEQITGEAVLGLYQKRIAELERIVRDHDLVTLPARPMRFRLATAAETASEPAPHIDLQGIFGKKTELTFVLPLALPPGKGPALKYDDFTWEAAAWPVAAHEGRPGHDLQLSIVSEKGLSTARKLFAFNAANVEGWGLYAERLVEPYLPPDGRLALLQLRMVRQARAFLDPELQLGKTTLEAARKVLEEEVGVSPALAKSELDRYTFQAPGQATAYFYGYTAMLELRAEAEKRMGPRFSAKAFHDFVLAQGLLPPPLLKQAVLEHLVAGK